jgi:SAM-dependent methyltransferase
MKRYNKTKKCPYCGSNNLKLVRDTYSIINRKIYFLKHCITCDLEFFTPLEFEDIYTNERIEEYRLRHINLNRFFPWTEEVVRLLKKINIDLNNKKILDIGAGDGNNFLRLKKEFNFEINNYYALELDNKSIKICKEKGVKHVINDYFDREILKKINVTFDLIISTEVLEHQIRPREFIETALNLLNDSRILVLTVPNRDRWFFKDGNGDIPPHHFLRFNKKFFLRNFNNIFYLGSYTIKSLTEISKNLSKRLNDNNVFYPFLFPMALIIKMIYYFSPGQGLIIGLKKRSNN